MAKRDSTQPTEDLAAALSTLSEKELMLISDLVDILHDRNIPRGDCALTNAA